MSASLLLRACYRCVLRPSARVGLRLRFLQPAGSGAGRCLRLLASGDTTEIRASARLRSRSTGISVGATHSTRTLATERSRQSSGTPEHSSLPNQKIIHIQVPSEQHLDSSSSSELRFLLFGYYFESPRGAHTHSSDIHNFTTRWCWRSGAASCTTSAGTTRSRIYSSNTASTTSTRSASSASTTSRSHDSPSAFSQGTATDVRPVTET